MKLVTLCCFAAAFAFAACKTTTEPNSGSSTSTTPGKGSYWIKQHTEIDSTGSVVNTSLSKETVVATGLSYGGKTGVLELIDSSGSAFDTSYIHFESNGDISAYNGSGWLIEPFASQTTQSMTIDTVEQGVSLHEVFTLKGAGSGTQSVKGQPVSVQKVDGTVQFSSGLFGSVTVNVHLSYAPSVMNVVFEDQPAYADPTGGVNNETKTVVTDYQLK